MSWRAWLDRLQGRPTAPAPDVAPSPAPRAAASRPRLADLGLAMALHSDAAGEDACVGCGLCALLCPTRALRVEPGPIAAPRGGGPARGHAASFTLDADACVACELCCQVCPVDALHLFRAPGSAPRGVQDQAALRAAAAQAPPSRRRSPLGPQPGALPPRRPPPPLAAPRPRPAADLPGLRGPSTGAPGPLRPPPAHLGELPTSEPTRLETWAHPVDAPTDPETDDVEAVTGEQVTGELEDCSHGSATRAILEGLPDPGDWAPDDEEAPDHPTELDTLPRRPTHAVDPEDTAPIEPVRPPVRGR